jgi:hypothetical protein
MILKNPHSLRRKPESRNYSTDWIPAFQTVSQLKNRLISARHAGPDPASSIVSL